MDKEFVTYEQALALKELGFKEDCFGYYVITTLLITTDNVYDSKEIPVIKAPLKQQVFRWFREEYGLISRINRERLQNYYYQCGEGFTDEISGLGDYESYPEAENACIDKLIEIAKQ
jgi:hypothetical protein